MNGSRSAHPRHGDRSSLDALNRTIEGLEARIQGLMAGNGRKPAEPAVADDSRSRAPQPKAPERRAAEPAPRDPLAEIRERQRMLEQASQRAYRPEPARAETRYAPESGRMADRRPAPEAPRPAAMHQPETRSEMRHATPTRRDDIRQPAIAARVAEANQRRADLREFTDALTNLRQDLKRDISDGLSQDMQALREEVRAIKAQAQDQSFARDVQADLARLSQSIEHLTQQATPEATTLRNEVEDLRAVMDGLAREGTLRQMQDQWVGLEERMQEADTNALREELVTLAYRIDEIRNQLGLMADSPVIRALEQKLLALAGMMEQLGSRMKPSGQEFSEQFGQLDQRLDEISRAIAANARNASTAAHDELSMQRLEGGLSALMAHVETIGRTTADQSATDGLSQRIELLAGRIEDLAEEQATAQLQERIEQLSALVQELQPNGQQEEFTGYLSDISRKIDALDGHFGSEGLGDRLDFLARRIEEMETHSGSRDEVDDSAYLRIEDRLSDIAARLDEAATAPQGNDEALRGLEAQIAHLSTLISEPNTAPAAWPPEFDNRMAAIEGYMATNDEYIVEAARQAAEAVVEAYSRNISAGVPGSNADMAALSALAEDLKHLEELTRGSESRAHQTFEALHGTLVQIADRLDNLEGHLHASTALSHRDAEPARQPAFATAPIARHDMAAAPVAAPALSAALVAELADAAADTDVGRTETRLRETSAIGSTMAEHIPAAAAAREAVYEEAPKPARSSLIGGIARKLMPGSKAKPAAETPRAIVDPAPSIDPSLDPAPSHADAYADESDDVLPPEHQNDLLEPGSGAPDVKKILERVRASQAAGEFERSADRTGDRADYIAAARRAAKAAAQEADPSHMGSMPKRQAKAGKTKDVLGSEPKGPSAFSRHRRPILMAVGAVLLALMAMPLIKTVTGGAPAPQVATIEQPADPQPSVTADMAPQMQSQVAPQIEADTQAPAADVSDAAPPQTATAPDAPVIAEEAPADMAASEMPANGPIASEPAAESPVAEDAPVASAEEQSSSIDVPAAIEPASLADAARTGDANALFEIGARFTDGRGVQADPAEAAKWYRLAADRGLPPAQYRVGNLLEKGTGVERNLSEAISYYRLAAEAGNASAMHNLAVLYASGAAGNPDYAAAVEWFKNAADLGVADSQFNLAILYARGNGTRQDLEESYKWFAIAAKGGDTDAAGKRDEVAKAMRKEQLDSANAKLNAWSAKPLDPHANAVNLPDEWAAGKGITTASIDMTKAIRNIQAILNKNGFDAGTPDGKMGQKTVSAIKAFQTSVGQEPTGKVDDDMVRELLARNG